jgi:PAS domain S-box-containing protein
MLVYNQKDKSDNEHLRFILEAAGIGTWDLDPIQGLLVLDERCRSLFGFALGETIAYEEVLKYMHPQDALAVDAAVKKALDPKAEGAYEVRYRVIQGQNGGFRWLLSKGKAYFNAEGKAIRFAGTAQDITEAVLDREQAIVSARIAETALRGSNSGYFRVILDTDEMEYSPGCARILTGDENKRLPHDGFKKYIHPDDRLIRAAAFERGSLTGILDYEARIIWDDGSIHWMRATGTYFNNDSGKLSYITGTIHDTTEEVKKEQALAASEARFRSLVEEAPVATCLFVGREMRIEVANEIMLSYWGKDDSVLGKPFVEAVPEMIGQPFIDILQEVFDTGVTYTDNGARADIEINGVVGIYYFDFTYKPLLNAAGEVYAIMDMAVDVTEEVLARQKAEEAEASLRGAIELAALGTWELDLRTTELQYSDRLKEWFGFGPDEVITVEKAVSVMTTEDRERVTKALHDAEESGTYDMEYRVYADKERVLHAHGKTFYNDKHEAYKIIGTAQDVTTQRALQQSLEQEVLLRTEELQTVNEELGVANEELNDTNKQLLHSNEELAQYAYVASHDLQEPLRKIRLFSGMLENQANLPAENKPMVSKIAQSAERMSMLIRDLLDFSRLLKSDAHMQPVDLSAILQAVISDFELTIEEKQATVRIGRLPVIEAVALQMNQLFYNLLGNALKFTRPDIAPEIVIDAQILDPEEVKQYISGPLLHRNYYRISFSDNGIGFETKYAEQIFEVFKRLHGRHVYPGSGIGLALCKRIVMNHNGYVYVQSEENRGTTFYIILGDKRSS